MKKQQLYILLNVIYNNSSVKNLTRQGMTFEQIAKQTNSAIKSDYISYTKERLVLTEKGIELLKELEIKYKKTNKNEWIEEDLKSKIPKLEKNVLFLPNQNELTF